MTHNGSAKDTGGIIVRCCSCGCSGGTPGPAGPPGPPGPPGTGAAAIYGGAYNTATIDIIYPGPVEAYGIEMNTPMSLRGVGLNQSGMVIETPGVYEVTYYGNFSYSSGTYFELYLEASAQRIRTSVVRLNVVPREMTDFQRSFLQLMSAGTIIQCFADIDDGGELYIPSGGFGLMVKLLSEA